MSRGGTTDRPTAALYIGTLTLTAAAAMTMQLIAMRTPALQTDEARGTLRIYSSAATAAGLAVALIVSVTTPGVGLKALLVLLPVAPLGRLDRFRR